MLVIGFLPNNVPCDIDNVCEVTGLTREEVLSLESINVLDVPNNFRKIKPPEIPELKGFESYISGQENRRNRRKLKQKK